MKKLLFFISLLFAIAFQLNAQEFIKQLYSYDRGNPDDNDGVYLVGTKVNIIVISADNRTNLQGTISIESKKLEYNTGIRSLENLGAGIYQYVWDTSQLSKGNDYIVFVRLRDESGKVSDGNFLIELYTSDLLLGTINSYDSSNPEDADNIYHAGQKVKISVAYNTKEPPNGMLEIRSETTGYILRKIELQKGTENTLEYVWDTKGLNEARDYVVTITLADQAGHQVTSRSLVITIDNTPPEILKVTAYNSQDILDNDNIYRSGQTIAIDVQMKEKQGNLDAKIQIKSQSVLYDTGIQRLIYQGEGLWRYLWNTTRLNPAKDYVAYIIIADQAALEDQNSSLRFEIDNTPPQNGKISINNDDIYTISRTVNLSLYADGASRMYISGNVDDTIATFEWIPYSTELQVELTKGDGNKSISVRFIDEAQNESQSFSDSIILDAEPPEIKMVSSQDKSDRLDNDNIYSAGQIITITAEISENLVKLEGVLSITSVSNSYNSGLQKMTDAGQGVYVFDWNTSGLLEGNYVVSIELTDPLGRKATNRELRIIIDNTPPDNGKLIINNGKNVTESRTIKLTLFASGDPREVFIEGNLIADTNTFQWIPYNTQVIVNLSDSDGEKKVQVRFRDAARNVGSIVTETITLDRKAPTSPSISIENNAPYTTKRTVTLRIKADNAVRMLINGDVLNEDFTFDFIDYREQVTVTLTPGDGEKRVGVVFRNSLGIQSDRIEDTIFLDTTEPVFMSIESYDFQNTLDNDGIYRPGQNIVISVVAGVVEVSLKARIKITSKKAPYDTGFQEMFPGINRTTFTYLWNTKSLQDSDDYNVLIELTDAAGHKTENSSLVITIDSSPPTNGQMTINEDSETTDSRTVRLRLSAVDATEMFISGDLFDDGNTFRWINYKTDLMVNLSGDDGLKTVQVKFRDAAGNENSGVIKTIKLDRKSPISLKLSISPDPDGIPSEYTPYREVYLRLSAYNAIEMYISGDVVDDEKTFQWISYTTQLKVNLIQNDGLKTILARFRNLPGILSEQVSSQIILDTTRPEIISVTSQNAQDPNDRDGWYRPGLIRIIAQVKEANEPELKITIESQKNGYNSGKQTMRLQTPAIGDRWTFEYIWDTRGLDDSSDYSINVEAKDKVGWVSTFTPDVLILDSIPPKNPKITVNKGNLRTASRSVSLEAWADDGVEMFVTGDIRDDDNTFQWISITTINVMLNAGEGLKNIQVKFRDGAGNETETLKAELILSLLPPVIQIVDSWDTSDPSDNDEKYHAGELISINIKAQSREDAPRIETGLFGTVTIQSSDGKYKSGRKSTREEIGGWYSYNWDTKGLAEGVYEVIATLADGLGREVTDQSLRIVIDNTPPDSPMININDRAKYTNSRAVNLSLQANEATWVFISGDVIQEKAITSEWIPYKDGFRITVKLTATEGVKKIQAKFKDDADNFTDFVSSQIILDTTGPRIISAEINNGNKYTISKSVKLELKAEDAVEMYIDGDVTLSPSVRKWIPYQETLDLELTDIDGEKSISVEFKDTAGNYSNKVSDTIILDTTPPKAISVKSINSIDPTDDDGRYISGTKVRITADMNETGLDANIQISSNLSGYASGIQKMQDATGRGNYVYLWDTTFLKSADDYIAKLEFRDEAGNSAIYESLVMSIFEKPIEQKIIINDGEEITTHQLVKVKISGDNIAEMHISGDVIDDSNTFDWIKFSSSKELILTPGDGEKKIEVIFRDNLNRRIGSNVASIILDQFPPTIAYVKAVNKVYSSGKRAEIIVQAGNREAGLESLVQIRSLSNGYDSGIQRAIERLPGEYVYFWDTTGLKESQDYIVEVTLKDKAGWTSKDNRLIIVIDNTPPEGGEIILESEVTQKRSIKLNFVIPKDAVDIFIEGDILRDSNTFQWVPVSRVVKNLVVNLNVGDGKKSIRVKFRDEAGNETKTMEKIIVLNENPPVILSVDSQDSEDPRDNDKIYRAGQIIRIIIKAKDEEDIKESRLEAWARITSKMSGYDSGLLTADSEGKDTYVINWRTFSLPEASDYLISVILQDGFGQRAYNDTLIITIDNTPPRPPKLTINNGKESTNSQRVKIVLTEAEKGITPFDGAVEMFIAGDVSEGFNTLQWLPFVDTKEIDLSEGNGTKIVTVKLKDSAGNISEVASAKIILDKSVPSSPSISINGGSKYTESHDIKLHLNAQNAKEMLISGNLVRSENTFQWIAYDEEISVRLTQGEGEKVVSAKFRNGIGNESDEVEARIILDLTAPRIKDIKVFDSADASDNDFVFHSGQKITFRVVAEKIEKDINGSIIITGKDFSTGRQNMSNPEPGVYTYLWNTDGVFDDRYLCEITLQDIAGRQANDKVTIIIDNQSPTSPFIALRNNEIMVFSRTAEIILRADGEPAEVFIGGDVINDDNTGRWIPYSIKNDEMLLPINLSGTDGPKKITAKFRDKARSESPLAKLEVILEIKRPEFAKSCRIVQTNDDPSQAFLSLQFDEPIQKIDFKGFFLILREKSNPQNFIQLDGTSTKPSLANDTVMLEIPPDKLRILMQWQPLSYAYSYIQAEIAENCVFDLANKGNLSNSGKPSDVYFVPAVASVNMIANPISFSPNDDNIKDKTVITYSLARTSDVTIRIMNSQGEKVKEWKITNQTGGLVYSVEWNGKKDDENLLLDGDYTVILISTSLDASGFAYGLKSKVTIDNSAPQIVNINPWKGTKIPILFRASIKVIDTPVTSGIESVYITVLGDVENKFLLAKSKIEGEYVIPANSQLVLPPGKQDVIFYVTDNAGNKTEKAVDYIVVPELKAMLNVMNFPNPFNICSETNIKYSLPEDVKIGRLVIYDAGSDVVFFKELEGEELHNGDHTFSWDGKDMVGKSLSRGVYFCRLWISRESGEESKVHKIAIK